MLVMRLLLLAFLGLLELASSSQPRARRRVRHVLDGPFADDVTDGEVFSPQIVLSESRGTSTGEWTGHRIWPSAVVLLKHLHTTVGEKMQGLRVLELGCGLPLVGATLAALGAEVCSTDLPDMLPYAEDALTKLPKGASLTGLSAAARSRLRLRPLAWGESSTEVSLQRNLSQLCGFAGPVDLVIGADLVYDKFPVELLQETLVSALRLNGATAVLALQHRRFPQASYLSEPQKVSSFLRRVAAQPGGAWDMAINRASQEAAAEVGQDHVEDIVIATIVPAGARRIEQPGKEKQGLHYLKETLPQLDRSEEL